MPQRSARDRRRNQQDEPRNIHRSQVRMDLGLQSEESGEACFDLCNRRADRIEKKKLGLRTEGGAAGAQKLHKPCKNDRWPGTSWHLKCRFGRTRGGALSMNHVWRPLSEAALPPGL